MTKEWLNETISRYAPISMVTIISYGSEDLSGEVWDPHTPPYTRRPFSKLPAVRISDGCKAIVSTGNSTPDIRIEDGIVVKISTILPNNDVGQEKVPGARIRIADPNEPLGERIIALINNSSVSLPGHPTINATYTRPQGK